MVVPLTAYDQRYFVVQELWKMLSAFYFLPTWEIKKEINQKTEHHFILSAIFKFKNTVNSYEGSDRKMSVLRRNINDSKSPQKQILVLCFFSQYWRPRNSGCLVVRWVFLTDEIEMFPILTKVWVDLPLRSPHSPSFHKLAGDCDSQHPHIREGGGWGKLSCPQYFQRLVGRSR